ncbi:MAG: hypothetical protein AB8B66_02995, partial [Rickettsiaceae bacterium]
MPEVINNQQEVILTTAGEDPVSLRIQNQNGIYIRPDDEENTTIIVGNKQIESTDVTDGAQQSGIQLLEAETAAIVYNQMAEAEIIEEQIVAAIAETIVNGATENQIQEAVAEENPVQENPVQVAEVEAN